MKRLGRRSAKTHTGEGSPPLTTCGESRFLVACASWRDLLHYASAGSRRQQQSCRPVAIKRGASESSMRRTVTAQIREWPSIPMRHCAELLSLKQNNLWKIACPRCI